MNVKTRRMLGYWAQTMSLYVFCLAILWMEVWVGHTATSQAFVLSAFIGCGQILVLLLIIFNRQIGIRLASIATLQGTHAISATVMAYACVGPVRGGTLQLLLVALVFCSFTLKRSTSRRLAAFAIVLLGATSGWLFITDPTRHPLDEEIFYFVLASSMLVAVSFLTEQFDYLRRRLEAEKVVLGDALAQIQILATRDELTRLPNRRHLNQVLSDQVADLKQAASPMCVVLVDIDFFKRVNDQYGHATGDRVLQAFATHLESFMRATDVVGRWGGEEFLILLRQTDEVSATSFLQRMQAQPLVFTPPAPGSARTITFSAGLASVRSGEIITDAIDRADKAMFQAKAAGRNTFAVFGGAPA